MNAVPSMGRRGRVWLACVFVSTIFSSSAPAELYGPVPDPKIPPSPVKAPALEVAKTNNPPKIDGVLDDPCWKTATHLEGFFRFHSNDPIKEQTEAWMCADATHLYFAFHCIDHHPELIKANETQREGDLSHDDQVGIAIDSQTNRRNVSQFSVSARGTQLTQIEGGTADNLTWAGDWTAATHRVEDGWTAEISIPFSLLRYPKGAKSFGLALIRQLARETNAEIWPYVPPEGNNNPLPYLCDCRGIQPPFYPPHLVALPYVLGTAGSPTTLRAGIDLKYPLSTTLTGIASLFPDFQTVEQSVQNLSFSYTEKYLPDRRPFFVEGSNFMGDTSLFYSQRIPMVDEGVKVVGKQGPTTISALATNAREDGTGQSATFANVAQDLGLYSQVGVSALSNNSLGQPANRVERVFGQYGYGHAGRQFFFSGSDTESWLAGGTQDRSNYFQWSTGAGNGKPYASAFYTSTGANFVNQLGLIPEVNLVGEGFNVGRSDNHDKGRLEYDSINLSASTYGHRTGGFFHDDLSASSYWGMRSGLAYELDADWGKYFPYKDNTVTTAFYWGQKTLFNQGNISYQFGHREDQPYQYLTLSEGVPISRAFSLNGTIGLETLDGQQNTQTIVTGTYRVNPQEAFGGRVVQQNGDIDVYLSYSRRVRKGTDIFILIGDPNSARTRGQLTVKLVHPL
jgi:hypothetical protein